MAKQSLNDENESVVVAKGKVESLISALTFLAYSAAHSITQKTLNQLPTIPAQALKRAVSEDGYDADRDLQRGVTVLHMVSGRVERDVVFAHLNTEDVSFSSIDYVVEASGLLGRTYNASSPGMVFLDYSLLTDDSYPVFVSGSSQYLGRWNPDLALPLDFQGSGRGGYHWFIRLGLFPGESIDFKFFKKITQWESGENRTFVAGKQNASDGDRFRG